MYLSKLIPEYKDNVLMKTDIPEIDFVIPWVDGSDPDWIESFNKYLPGKKDKLDIRNIRYRDYGALRYWFRGVEKFAPWVRKVHFITNGQKPDWLNLSYKKLNWVKHDDYIPSKYLPVFNATPIELYMHKIYGLAEHFIYFNDDFFLTKYTDQTHYFKKGLPCDSAILNANSIGSTVHNVMNAIALINKYFTKRQVIKNNFNKWINVKYGVSLLRTLCLLPWPNFTGFLDIHMPIPYTKTLINRIWEHCSSILEGSMASRYRSDYDVNQWLFRYWSLVEGNFYPIHPYNDRGYFELSENNDNLFSSIKEQKYKEVVINDSDYDNIDEELKKLVMCFDAILPGKSSFEI
jgi:hypothetical protein